MYIKSILKHTASNNESAIVCIEDHHSFCVERILSYQPSSIYDNNQEIL